MLLYMGKKCEISNTLHHIYEKVPVMNVKRLLIAACSQTLRDTLSEELSGVFQVATCDEGNDTLQLIKSYRPDILVLDLMLPGLDGVSLLRALRPVQPLPRVVALSSYISSYVTAALEELQVCCLIRLPSSARSIAARVFDVAIWEHNAGNLCRDIQSVLAVLGLKRSTVGYHITVLALLKMIEQPRLPMTTALYPAVARICGGTPTQVEKAIRDSIRTAWEQREPRYWSLYFPAMREKPSNAEFLVSIAAVLREKAQAAPPRQKLG